MVPDAESLRVMYEVLRDLKIGKFVIKVMAKLAVYM